ncbi:type IA DNA topoisomerase [Thermoflavimicrobium daqui]|uniref:DNA topoisomerase n=1 Tax=Thermoflavimicrobium daqui TaxID=2137476 RepID=A0A364K0R8_9BACL|nr:type IA DNA topoisomerase [Thermoflavimicrobium daqui]RAL21020.1 DNA topoisomerase III [Thermoflavimicrobium daqui]
MNVILAEKPDQARKLASPFVHKKEKSLIRIAPCTTFPQGAVVIWAIGHLCELVEPEKYNPMWKKWRLESLPIIPAQFKHRIIKQKAGHFQFIKGILNKADTIIIATDPAREGEYIARIIIQLAGASKKEIKRLWCSSLTESAIKQAFSNLRQGQETQALYDEALARAYSDWLVGINTSRAYTLLMQQKGIKDVFSTGRVQTPLLCLIRRREEEIEQFKEEPFWEIEAMFDTGKEKYKGKYKERFFVKKEAENLLTRLMGQPAFVYKIKADLKKVKPPMFHSLSTLQAKMNRKYKFPPAKVLQLVQSLYEKGYVSYPRSDSQHVTPAEAREFPCIINLLRKQFQISKKLKDIRQNGRYVNAKKVSDHYAIIPTEQVPTLPQLPPDERKIYDEIARSLIAAHYPDYEYIQTKVTTKIDPYEFESLGKKVTQRGWKEVFQEEKEEENQPLPKLQEGQQVDPSLSLKEGITQPPKPYTEGQLITLMKTAGKHIEDEDLSSMKGMGLGTEATRAGMIQTLKERNYIEVKRNIVSTTKKGKMLVNAVGDTILGKADLTAKWEQYLHGIGQGKKLPVHFIEKSKELARHLVEDAISRAKKWKISESVQQDGQTSKKPEILGICPVCGKGIIDRKTFYGCIGYQRGCKFTLPSKLLGKKISKAHIKKLLSGKKTGLIKGFVSKKGTKFDAYLRFVDGKITFEFFNQKEFTKADP